MQQALQARSDTSSSRFQLEPHNSYKNGVALRQGWGALVPVATLTKEIARGGGQ